MWQYFTNVLDLNDLKNSEGLGLEPLTGKWDKQDESRLDTYDLRLLEKIRNHNTVLIALHPVQKDRKQLMDEFVKAYRIKYPRFQLIP